MKRNLILIAFLFLVVSAWAQENAVTLGGGSASTKIEDSDTKMSGYRINGSYEYMQGGGKWSHGVVFSFISMSGEETFGTAGQQVQKYKINSFPLYYVPKFMFGSDKFKGFVKGALGMQFSGLDQEGPIATLSDSDFGFYGGGGAGAMYFVKDNVFISADYEIAWLSNGWYKDGWVNSINGGIGFKF